MSKVLNKHGVKAAMLFIAELNGFKAGTPKQKLHYGVTCWLSSTLHNPNYLTEAGRSEAHENIWLERIYNALDKHFNALPITKRKALEDRDALVYLASKHLQSNYEWNIPLELDASASMIQYIGALMGDERLLSMTNVIGSTLSDPWAFEGIPRTQFKHAATPMLYGSSKACHELWQDKKHDYTLDQVQAFNQELNTGALGVANAFKEFVITNVKPKEHMLVHIFNEKFNIECNRYKHIGDHTDIFKLYDSETGHVKTFHHTTVKKVADLDQFRRYFVTLLIHNLDSQVANTVIGKVMDKYGWGIDIHDAFIVHPNAALDVRRWYAQELTNIYNNRHAILANYFASIGIGAEAQAQWNTVKSLVHPLTGAFKANLMALK